MPTNVFYAGQKDYVQLLNALWDRASVALTGTSTTSLAVGTGAKSLVTDTSRQWSAGDFVRIKRTSNPSGVYMTGTVTSYTPTTGALVVNVLSVTGTGTFTDWTITISGERGDTGATGPKGDTGDTGATGATGPANTLAIGTVTTGAAGSSASATVTGTAPNQTLNLTIPRGNTGVTGAAGLTHRGAWASATAYVINDAVTYLGSTYRRKVAGTTGTNPAGDTTNWELLAGKGDTGATGPANTLSIGTVTTGAAGSSAAATVTGAAPNQTLNLTIPTGATGATGSTGPAGLVWQGVWVSGTTYAVNDAVTSVGSSYRRKVAGAGTTAPAGDATNWELIAQKGADGTGNVSTVNNIAPVAGNVTLTAANVGAVPTTGGTLNGNLTLSHAAPGYHFIESDQAGAAGKWRMVADAGEWRLDRNTAAAGDYSAYTSDLKFATNGWPNFSANGASFNGKSLTLGGALTTSGAYASTFTMTGTTSVTFPTSGTLLSSVSPSVSDLNTLVGNSFFGYADTTTGASLAPSGAAFDGCGIQMVHNTGQRVQLMMAVGTYGWEYRVDDGGNSSGGTFGAYTRLWDSNNLPITLGGALTTSGAYASTFTMTGATSVTFPTSGTLLSSTGGDIANAGVLTFADITQIEGRIQANGGVMYVQVGNTSADTTGVLTFSRYATTTSNFASFNVYADNTTYYGAVKHNGVTTISAGAATAQQDYLQLKPTDYGVGKPMLVLKSLVGAGDWECLLYDGTGSTGRLFFNTSEVKVTNLLTAGSLTLTTALAANDGGTGFDTYTVGDILYADTTTTLAKLPASTSGRVLVTNGAGTAPTWSGLDLAFLTTAWTKKGVRAATTAALTASYSSNVLTNTGTLAALVIDGVTMATNNRVLVKNQANPVHNGIYYVSNIGSGSVAWTLTRSADCNFADEMGSATVSVAEGTQGGQLWRTNFKETDTVGTSVINWYQVWDSNNPTITTYTETVYAPAAGSAFTVDLANGPIQRFTTNANTTITLPAAVAGKSYIIEIIYGGAHTVTFAGGTAIKWPGNTAPTITSVLDKRDKFSFQCPTNTFTDGSVIGLNYPS